MVRGLTRKKTVLHKSDKRTASSNRWLTRQLNDPFAKAAKDQGLRCRAAFKIQEIDEKFKLIHDHQVVFDLGAAPGGWSEYVVKKNPHGQTIALDLLDIKPIEGVIFKQGDFTHPSLQNWLSQFGMADVILSDIAPNTSGIQAADHLRLMAILDDILDFTQTQLKPGGALVAKTFRGGTDGDLLLKLKKMFKSVKHFKPNSSRKESVEMFVVAQGFKK